MQITVNVADVDLNSVVGATPGGYDPDSESEYAGRPITLLDQVVGELADRAYRSEGRELRERVAKLRNEEIRAQLAPIVTEAINGPIVKTNGYGEPLRNGETTTLRELIVAEVHKCMRSKPDGYGRNSASLVQTIVAEEVGKAFRAELTDVIKGERDKVIAAVRTQASTIIADAVAAGLKARA